MGEKRSRNWIRHNRSSTQQCGFDASTMKVTDMSVFGEQTEESKDVLLQKLKKCLTSDGLHSEVRLGPKSYSLKKKPIGNAVGFEESPKDERNCISKCTSMGPEEMKEVSCDQVKEEPAARELTGKQKK